MLKGRKKLTAEVIRSVFLSSLLTLHIATPLSLNKVLALAVAISKCFKDIHLKQTAMISAKEFPLKSIK